MAGDRKTRLISFRLSEVEYNELKSKCLAGDSRSLSDLTRAALNRLIGAHQESQESSGLEPSSLHAISRLTEPMQSLDASINRLTMLVETQYTSSASRVPPGRPDGFGETPGEGEGGQA